MYNYENVVKEFLNLASLRAISQVSSLDEELREREIRSFADISQMVNVLENASLS